MEKKNRIDIQTLNGQPSVNVCIFKNKPHIDLKYDHQFFDLFDLEGNKILDDIKEHLVWRIKIKQVNPAIYQYYLILRESKDLDLIKQFYSDYKKNESNLLIKQFGGEVYLNNRLVTLNRKYAILAGPFQNERDARHNFRIYGQLNNCRIHRQLVEPGSGQIEIFDSECEYYSETQKGLTLMPKNVESYFELQHFEINNYSDRKAYHEDLFYQGALTIKIDENNSLTGINQIPLELYLKGVLYSEVGEQVPLEFAKSMAIVSRSQIFACLGQKHEGEDFDFCCDGHCLRYFGKNFKNHIIEQAVAETRGVILGKDNNICNAYFSYSCGGHTENASGVWLDDDSNYAKGKYDGDETQNAKLDLTVEAETKKWILSRPNVYCRQNSNKSPGSLEVNSDSFRWDIFYTRNELQEILGNKTGEELGIIYDIIPLNRGVSGRIKEIEILGSLKNVRISGELNIRSALSETLLNSSCFYIKPEIDDDGVPISFLFIGAGKGHGVGLCKVGAAAMATNGKTVDEILLHYFDNCQKMRIY